jgi:hypothetical protein
LLFTGRKLESFQAALIECKVYEISSSHSNEYEDDSLPFPLPSTTGSLPHAVSSPDRHHFLIGLTKIQN